MVAPPHSSRCQSWLDTLLSECRSLGVPIAPHKTKGPTAVITFLGIEIDTIRGDLRLPQDKLDRLNTLLDDWGDWKGCMRRDLESLIGLLNNACKVVRPGRSFLCRMIDLLHAVNRPCSGSPRSGYHGFRADLAWWREFLVQWNGISILSPPSSLPKVHLFTDASGSWGCAVWHVDSWFQVQWDHRAQPLSIAEKELVPSWTGCQVVCHCDNQAVAADLCLRSSRQKG